MVCSCIVIHIYHSHECMYFTGIFQIKQNCKIDSIFKIRHEATAVNFALSQCRDLPGSIYPSTLETPSNTVWGSEL